MREDAQTLRAAMLVRDEMRAPGLASSLYWTAWPPCPPSACCAAGPTSPCPPPPARGGLAPWQVLRVRQIIADRLSEELRLEELALSVGLSTFHFARAFKRSTGMTPHRFQTRERLRAAREMLLQTKLGVLQIALSVGYESGQALARAFCPEYGLSPASVRRDAVT